jgi:sulfate permease
LSSIGLVDALLVAFSFVFALNMGGSGFSPAFSAALGSRVIKKPLALALFAVCVGIGAIVIGGHVAKTLGGGLVAADSIDRRTALFVISSATGALLIANLAKIPESTSWVTVFAISSLGLFRGNLNTHTIFYKVLPTWLSIPPIAFLLTWFVTRRLYPLRGWNYRLYEHLTKHEWKLRALVVASSCYLAIGVGANNVANVVAPLSSAGVFSVRTGMLLFTPVFALGGLVFSRTASNIGKNLVPIGLYSATIINVVVGSLVLAISWLGIPQSLVQAHVLAVFAIALAKEGSQELSKNRVLRKIVVFWILSPLVASALIVIQLLLFG